MGGRRRARRDDAAPGQKTELAIGEGLTGHVALTQEPLVVDDVLTDPRTVNAEWMRQQGAVSSISIPGARVVQGALECRRAGLDSPGGGPRSALAILTE